jgi:hypothetical protein
MNRRRFLGVSAVSALAGLTGGTRGARASAAVDLQGLAQPDLLTMIGPETVREIGLRYRALVPAESEAHALHAAILAARHWRPSIADLVEADFATGRTIVVQGWVVSITEARQSALFSLLSD